MSCYTPLSIRDNKGDPVQVPCGYCIGCRLDKAKDWAIRCVNESQMHLNNCYITLTYNNENLPKNMSVSKKDFQNFMKSLREYFAYPGTMPKLDKANRIQFFKIGKKKGEPKVEKVYRNIKFYACGEYGDKFSRPHYHACLFGIDFSDKEFWRFSQTGFPMYRSKILEKIWTKGYSSIGDVTLETAGYCARYVQKKVYGDIDVQADHYNGRHPEFALMSRRPGIGSSWFDKYSCDVYPKDFYHVNGHVHKPSRYYDTLYEKKGGDIEKIKQKRLEKIIEEDSKRLFEKHHHKKCITKNLQRSFT